MELRHSYPAEPAPPVRGGPAHLIAWVDRGIERLNPGAFALVMATGIIATAFFFDGPRGLSDALFAFTAVAYLWLWIATLARLVLHARALAADLVNPRLVFAFFTVVAGSDVLGAGFDSRGFHTTALALWFAALVLWFLLIYFSFGVLTFLNRARQLSVVDGGWLIAIVGTESLVLLGAQIAPALGEAAAIVFVAIHMLWGIGLILYGIFITLFAYRIFFFNFAPEDITPPLWVVMGAAAIATNAGSTLILTDTGIAYLAAIRPMIDGVTLVLWAWATWWIPLLVLFGIWKHGFCRVPLAYSHGLWSLVFPLGMYAVASLRLGLAAEFVPLDDLSHAVVWIALAAWVATAAGLVAATWRSWRDFAATDP